MEKLNREFIAKFIVGAIGLLVGLAAYLLHDRYSTISLAVSAIEKDLSKITNRMESLYEISLRLRVDADKLHEIQSQRGERLARLEVEIERLKERASKNR